MPDRFHIGSARSGFFAAELLDDRGIVALGLGDVLLVEIMQPLRSCRRERQRDRGKQQNGLTHRLTPFHRFATELSARILNGK